MGRSFCAQFDLGVRARAFDVVGDGDAGFKFVARRGQDRHARRDHERSANECVTISGPDRLAGNADRHYFQVPIKEIGNVVGDFTRGRVGVENARPKDDRLFCDALERIQLLHFAAVSAKGGKRAQEREFRDDKIDNLRRLDAERAFAEEISKWIRHFVIGDLQNSLIDREDDDL